MRTVKTFQIIVKNKIKAEVLGYDEVEATKRARDRFPSLAHTMFTVRLVRFVCQATDFSGRVYNGPAADSNVEALDALRAQLRQQFNVAPHLDPLDDINNITYIPQKAN